MKKEEVFKLLKKRKYTYKELAKITGYHEKYLIKLNKIAKENNYQVINKNIGKQNHIINLNIKKIIIDEWYKKFYRNYKEFYLYLIKKYNFKISYSFLCRYLSNIKYQINCLIIKKEKKNNKYYITAIDYQTNTIIASIENKKNNYKSVKELLFQVFRANGVPFNIVFINLFKNNPFTNIFNKYQITLIPSSNIFSKVKGLENKKVTYRHKDIDLKDFYQRKELKTISDNLVQFKNTRYEIDSKIYIKHLEKVTLYYNNVNNHKFITYQNKEYNLKVYKTLNSKKGLSKYS